MTPVPFEGKYLTPAQLVDCYRQRLVGLEVVRLETYLTRVANPEYVPGEEEAERLARVEAAIGRLEADLRSSLPREGV